MMKSPLREDEQFVIEALCASYEGTWRPGENPPDAYLKLTDDEVAVEISTLTQHVMSDSGEAIPLLSQDVGALRLCNELNDELTYVIPNGIYVILTLYAPITKIKKFKDSLAELISNMVAPRLSMCEVQEILGNEVRIHIVLGERPSGKKVVGLVVNRNSSADIFANIQSVLNDRVTEKTQKCIKVQHRPIWLALFNDYWIANPRSYKQAMDAFSVSHPFAKVLLVLGNREVHSIYET